MNTRWILQDEEFATLKNYGAAVIGSLRERRARYLYLALLSLKQEGFKLEDSELVEPLDFALAG